jgi:TonB-linked SusC/RagA family outer membrane protein
MRQILLLLLSVVLGVGQLAAQTKTISGKVTDAAGSPLPNVSVVVKGSTVGTSTKSDGTYSITVSAQAKTLVFSSVGLEPVEVSIGSKTSIDARLTNEVKELTEVVVQVPYGTVKKTAFTGSEATVTAQSISKQQVTSVTKALEGLVPGVIATNGGGAPGTGASILVRGIGSYSGSSSPLFVLNGVPYDGPISSISTDEIEAVTVLKDAAAAALYGSRAANGVVMITTKKGKRGKSAVSATVRQGFMSRGIPEYDRVDQKEYYELMWEATRNSFVYASNQSFATAGVNASQQLTDGNHLVYNAYDVPGNQLVDPVTGKLNPNAKLRWTDSWEDELFRSASRTNVNVNISGAGDKSDYFLSFGYLNEEGTVKYTGYKRYNARINLNTAPTSWLNSGLNIDGAFSERKQAVGETGGTAGSNSFFFSRGVAPIYPVFEYNPVTGAPLYDSIIGGRKHDWGGNGSNMGTRPYLANVNPLGSLLLDDRSTKTLSVNANAYMEVKFLKDFSFKTTMGINLWDDNATTFQNSLYGDASANGGRSTKNSDRQLSLTINEVLTWNKTFGSHSLRALAGHENYKYQYNLVSANKQGFQFPGQSELDNGTEIFGQPSSYQLDHRIESYFAGVNYDYDEKYLFSASYRTDGSSRFSDSVRWGNFYSAGIGWRISAEDFLKNVDWLNELKFKASYGEQGNENLGDLYYPYKLWYYADGTGGYTTPTRPASPGLKWEGNKTFNVGFDFSVFSNRLQGTVEYFNRISDDLLFDVPQALSTGNLRAYQNIGTLKNTGIELQLGYNAIRGKDFDWRVDLNLTHFKNKFTKLPPKQTETGIIDGAHKLMPGRSRYDFWLREYAGVDASTGEALFYKDVLGSDGKPSGERVLTNNIAQASYYYKGSAIPDVTGGLVNSFRYKNFDLSFLLTFSYGGKFYDGNYASLMHTGAYGQAWHSDIAQRWQKPGDVTNVPKIQNGTQATQDGGSTRFLMDGSFLNVKNITLSYTLSKNIANRMHVSSVQFFGNVDNAYLFTAKKGMDPQRAFGGTADASYPPFRTITFGLNVSL